ncbi:hypothetical protein CONPUDRAFT_163061 [Coniophora puteana RWD-64-598 SS2]|uniref:C2H2-type domain-containing protein n=1 Tax=Coniophora puteana (strain RWD-64-598) TaxID=741705 RepID=A0A5M3MXM7_CONPW|nr:uncharacterized protein CONPUDRAFT_163061 [Coniophora puteana RWD-64-598 SS2]EIW83757.1 hypothetical protein CONPUDRAFT_163061 [Coniophora puteana RWD-64-598 SS2]
MSSSDVSITLSISQLLQFQVVAGLVDMQPNLQLKPTPQPTFAPVSSELSSVDIKVETQYVGGQRVLRIFALPSPGHPNFYNTPSSFLAPPTSNPLQCLTSGSANAMSDCASTATSPDDFDSFTQDELLGSYNNIFSTSSASTPEKTAPNCLSLPEHQWQPSMNTTALQACPYLSIANSPQYVAPTSPPYSIPSTASTPTFSTPAEEDTTGPRKRPRRFPCLDPSCPRRFANQYTLQLHMTTHQEIRKEPYHCEMGCSETFSRQHDRLRHEVARHGRVSEWTCNRCRHVFSTQSTRNKHKCPDLIPADNYRS